MVDYIKGMIYAISRAEYERTDDPFAKSVVIFWDETCTLTDLSGRRLGLATEMIGTSFLNTERKCPVYVRNVPLCHDYCVYILKGYSWHENFPEHCDK